MDPSNLLADFHESRAILLCQAGGKDRAVVDPGLEPAPEPDLGPESVMTLDPAHIFL